MALLDKIYSDQLAKFKTMTQDQQYEFLGLLNFDYELMQDFLDIMMQQEESQLTHKMHSHRYSI